MGCNKCLAETYFSLNDCFTHSPVHQLVVGCGLYMWTHVDSFPDLGLLLCYPCRIPELHTHIYIYMAQSLRVCCTVSLHTSTCPDL